MYRMRLLLGVLPLCVCGCLGTGTKPEAAKPLGDAPESVFDGKSLKGWKVADQFVFSTHGKVHVKDGSLLLDKGGPFTGICCKRALPNEGYEIELDAKRTSDMDIFCGIVCPVGDAHISFVMGGWSDNVVGISCVNWMAANDNETAKMMHFELNRWYHVRLRVTPEKVEAWIDNEKVVDLPRADRKLSLYLGLEPLVPFGFFTWETGSALKNITVRRVSE